MGDDLELADERTEPTVREREARSLRDAHDSFLHEEAADHRRRVTAGAAGGIPDQALRAEAAAERA